MQALLVDYLEELETCLSLFEHTRLMNKAKTMLSEKMFIRLQHCFDHQRGWLFVGLDFDSLEDKISAVTTKDPEKIKVYSDGYDGHCLRALAYFPEHMPDIELCPPGATSYKTEYEGKTVYFHSDEIINYLGDEMTGKELYAKINKN